MKNPFEKHKVELEVSLNDLLMLHGIICSCVPDVKNELPIYDLATQIRNKIEQLKNEP